MNTTSNQPGPQDLLTRWREVLNADQRGSLYRQTWSMMHSMAVHRAIRSQRYINLKRHGEAGPLKAPRLVTFIDHCYVDSQLATVRRTIGSSSKQATLTGSRGECALLPLLRDIQKHLPKITREQVFEHRKIDMDYEKLLELEDQYVLRHLSTDDNKGCWIPTDIDAGHSLQLHTDFDMLAGVPASDRSETDVIQPLVIDRLLLLLDQTKNKSIERTITHVNKTIAHSATPESIGMNGLPTLSLRDVNRSIRLIMLVTAFLDRFILVGATRFALEDCGREVALEVAGALGDHGDEADIEDGWRRFTRRTRRWCLPPDRLVRRIMPQPPSLERESDWRSP